MYSKANFFLSLVSILCLGACQPESKSPGIVGLWQIDLVTYEGEDMTPQGRWMCFNKDLTQTSGNGWTQHSIGTYQLKNDSLSVFNSNGWIDPNEAFAVQIQGDSMTWTRQEGGAPLQVKLSRITELPQTQADALYGYWVSETDSTESILFRWDKVFVLQTDSLRIQGSYRTHGHAPRIQLIYPESKEWQTYRCVGDSLILSEGEMEKRFLRNHHLED